MADPKLIGQKHGGSNPNNSTADPRIIWEDGTWAIIEAGDHEPGLARSETRDTLAKVIQTNSWDPARVTQPGKASIAQGQLVKVKLAELLATPQRPAAAPTQGQLTLAPVGAIPSPKGFIKIPATPDTAPNAPPSPFLPKSWKTRDIPEYPHTCLVCKGRYYQGLDKVIHQETEALDGGKCPGPRKKVTARVS
jgi:hypothetical protein